MLYIWFFILLSIIVITASAVSFACNQFLDGVPPLCSGICLPRCKYFIDLGINFSKSKFVCFLDADDFWHEDKIKIQAENYKNNPNFDIFVNNTFSISGKKKLGIRFNKKIIFDDENLKEGMVKNYIRPEGRYSFHPPSALMVKKKVFIDFGLYVFLIVGHFLFVEEIAGIWLSIKIIQVYGLLSLGIGFALGGYYALFKMKFVQEVKTCRVHGHVGIGSFVYDWNVVDAVRWSLSRD